MRRPCAATRVAAMEADKTPSTRRADERITARMPVRVGEDLGLTRDVSASGIFFEIDRHLALGSEVRFEIEMRTTLGLMKMCCTGQVVREEHNGERTGIAVRINDSQLEAVRQN